MKSMKEKLVFVGWVNPQPHERVISMPYLRQQPIHGTGHQALHLAK